MKHASSHFLVSLLGALICAHPVMAADEALTKEALLAHPDVSGALAVIDAWVEGVQIYKKVPGISVGIVHDQDLVWQNGYGYSNLENERPADANTLYSICSISKLFTAIGIMQLRDAGRLSLRDRVAEHLDWFDIEEAHRESGPATIEGLLTHSSGLPRESDYPYWVGPEFPFPTRAQMMDRLRSQQTLYPAHTYFQYSNLALSLAGEVIQELGGLSYERYIEQNILQPLGLSDTRTHYPEELRGEQMAVGYTGMHRDGMRHPVDPFFTRGITAAAGFTSSVNDLAKFASWQFRLLDGAEDDVLDPNTLREMQRVHWVNPDWEVTWGLGFNVRRVDDETYVGHSGGCPGYITQFVLSPKRKLAAIVLTNAGDGPAWSVAESIMGTMKGAIESAATPADEDAPDFSIYEGNYETQPWGGEIAIRQWGDQLVVVDLPSDDLEDAMTKLEHDGEHTFTRLTDSGDRREPWIFEIGSDGRASRVSVHSGYSTRIE